VKYPRTFHLPDSPGRPADDKVQHDLSWLDGELVVTEKLDGGNLTFTRDAMYARSLDSGTHPWDRPAKALWAMTAYRIPDDWRVCGESMWARAASRTRTCRGLHRLRHLGRDGHAARLGRHGGLGAAAGAAGGAGALSRRQPVRGARRLGGAALAGDSEGFVVRAAGRIPRPSFSHKVLKWVRPEHVRTDAAWRHRDDFAVNEFA
jgi:hypothetical protein